MIYSAGIDTLHVGFYLKQFNLSEDEWNQLKYFKEQAKAPAFRSSGAPMTFKNMPFVMSAAGKKPYTYVLQNEDFALKLAQKVSGGLFPEIFVELRSQFLWGLGYKYAYTFIREWIAQWTEIFADVVSRADLAVDIQGFPDLSIENIVSRARNEKQYLKLIPIENAECYYYGSATTGWVIGSGPLMLRIYDKLAEARKVHKGWFEDIWKESGWDGESDVTRVEIQTRRQLLKEFNVDTFEQLKKTMPDIFRYVTEDWFTLREPTADKNRSRWTVIPWWAAVQKATENFGFAYGFSRGRISEVKEDVLIPQAAGLITSLCATKEGASPEDILISLKRHFKKKGHTIEDAINEKKKRYSLFEDGHEPF